MPMSWRVDANGQRERVVREDVLLAELRDSLKNSPVHFNRMRAAAREYGLPEPARPKPVVRAPRPRAALESQAQHPRVQEPQTELKPMRGAAEYAALTDAIRTTRPACAGVDAFTADSVTEERAIAMDATCSRCELLELCRAYATAARPVAGYWPVSVSASAAS